MNKWEESSVMNAPQYADSHLSKIVFKKAIS